MSVGKQKYSKYDKYSYNAEIFPHKHCPVCNKMIPEDEDYCSEECRMIATKEEKGSKKKIIIFVVIYIVVIVAMFLVLFKMNS